MFIITYLFSLFFFKFYTKNLIKHLFIFLKTVASLFKRIFLNIRMSYTQSAHNSFIFFDSCKAFRSSEKK